MQLFPIFSVHLNESTAPAEENRTTVPHTRAVDAFLFSYVTADTYGSDWAAA